MKATIEIKDNKIIYSYEMGEENESGNIEISVQTFFAFSEILKIINSISGFRHQQMIKTIKGE